MRTSAIKRFTSPLASTSSLQSSSIRGYATCSEEAPDIDPSIYKRKVDMSVMEKGKGHYINYKKLDDNIKIVRER
jgi:aconitate hydratase